MIKIVEVIGLIGNIFIVFSMLCKSHTREGNLRMRTWNLIGSVIFIVYGIMLSAYSMILLNAIMVILHAYHIVVLLKEGDNTNNKC